MKKENIEAILEVLKQYADIDNWKYEWGTFVAGDGQLSIHAKACKWNGQYKLAPWTIAKDLLSSIDWSLENE